MKTSEKIKKGLERCAAHECGWECPYFTIIDLPSGDELGCYDDGLLPDALAYIQQLEAERDAMIESLRKSKACCVCANRNTRNPNKNTYDITAKCIRCVCGESQFEWRGVCEENKGDEGHGCKTGR